MKVLYAFPEPLPLPRARGVQAMHTVVELARLGLDVALYYVPGSGDPFTHYGLERPASLRVVPLSRSLPWPLHAVHSNRLFASRLLQAAGASLGEGVVLVRHLKLAALLLARRPEMKLVYEAHEVFADTAPAAKRQERRAEEARVVAGAAAVVSNSRATAARLAALYGKPRSEAVIPNGVDRPDTLPEKNWQQPGRHIIYAGSLFPWKGAADLVAAASLLPGCRIDLVGGEARGIAELRSAPGAGAQIVFHGERTHREVLERLSAACIAVLPNRDEADSAFTSPIKLFEYMASGCAVVATDLPALRELLDREEAAWAKPGSPESLAAAIGSLVREPQRARQLGERLREKSRRFTWAARAQRLRQLLQQVHPGATGRRPPQ
jgi:glycosyltransferase involved in cell wall biosynthesis